MTSHLDFATYCRSKNFHPKNEKGINPLKCINIQYCTNVHIVIMDKKAFIQLETSKENQRQHNIIRFEIDILSANISYFL